MEFIAVSPGGMLQLPPVLILPALSVGNVGQLATDLLISRRSVSKVGYLDAPYVLPCIGNDPFGPEADGTLAVALEVFEDPEGGLAIVQQRSPVVKGQMVEFAKDIAHWAENSGIKEVIILSGLDSGKRERREMVGPQIYYISSANSDGSDELCDQLGWKRLDQGGQLLQQQAVTTTDRLLIEESSYAGSPFALLFSSCKAQGLKVSCVLSFCSEGDNVPDAFLVAESLDSLLEQKERVICGTTQWRVPLSWTTVYGPPPDDSIF